MLFPPLLLRQRWLFASNKILHQPILHYALSYSILLKGVKNKGMCYKATGKTAAASSYLYPSCANSFIVFALVGAAAFCVAAIVHTFV